MRQTSDAKKSPQVRKNFFESVAGFLDSPVVAVSDSSFVELYSNTQAVVEGCKSILEYAPDLIRLECAHLAISFRGENLYIRSMTEDSAIICGTIVTVEYSTL